ncbi:MAG: shikimate kinase, partial [Bacteroidetes bacterium]
MLIFLIGYMGSGKSTTGKKLARRLGLPFYDLDLLISTHQGLSIPEIFQQKGEAQFRNVEAAQLRTLNENDHAVVSTGGGTPCHHHNMQW